MDQAGPKEHARSIGLVRKHRRITFELFGGLVVALLPFEHEGRVDLRVRFTLCFGVLLHESKVGRHRLVEVESLLGFVGDAKHGLRGIFRRGILFIQAFIEVSSAQGSARFFKAECGVVDHDVGELPLGVFIEQLQVAVCAGFQQLHSILNATICH